MYCLRRRQRPEKRSMEISSYKLEIDSIKEKIFHLGCTCWEFILILDGAVFHEQSLIL